MKKKNKKKTQNNFNFKYLKLLGNLNTVDILLFTSLLNVLFPCLYLFFLFIFVLIWENTRYILQMQFLKFCFYNASPTNMNIYLLDKDTIYTTVTTPHALSKCLSGKINILKMLPRKRKQQIRTLMKRTIWRYFFNSWFKKFRRFKQNSF